MTISVIIPTCNRPQEMKRLLDTVSGQSLAPREVIVVDQSDNDLTERLVNSFNSGQNRTNYIWFYQKEKSSAKARNAGYLHSQGEIISFTDDDVLLDKDYLYWVKRYFEQHAAIGGITGNLSVPNPPSGWKWAIRKSLLKFFLIDTFNGRLTASGFGYPLFRYEIKSLAYIELMSGYSMNFRKEVMELFDEFFTGYSFREDVDFSYRISKKTLMVAIPEARFEHHPSLENRDNALSLQKMALRNYHYIFEKHIRKSLFSDFLFAYSVSGIFLIDLIEWLLGFKQQKKERLIADFSALRTLLAKPKKA